MKLRSQKISPSKRLVFVILGFLFASLFLYWLPDELQPLFLLCEGVAVGFIFLDYLNAKKSGYLYVKRQIRHNLPVNVPSSVKIKIQNKSPIPHYICFHDHHPIHFNATGLPYCQVIPAKKTLQFEYQVIPQQRGDAVFKGFDLVVRSFFGLWNNYAFVVLEDQVKVFPNFKELVNLTLLAANNHLSQMGIRKQQRRGEGNDFHQLREYHAGDTLRQIDWKASSRYQKLISKEYQDERDQQILFLLDCGRKMQHQDNGRVHLDQALNAMLVLAFIAIEQGDAAGFMAFGGIDRWHPPKKNANAVTQLLHRTYDIHATTAAADYLMAAQNLLQLQRRRAMIIIITNSRAEDFEQLKSAVKLLARQHLVVIADLRESFLDEVLKAPVQNFDDALKYQSVKAYLTTRTQQRRHLTHLGALVLDVTARQLPVTLVNQYLAIKQAGRL